MRGQLELVMLLMFVILTLVSAGAILTTYTEETIADLDQHQVRVADIRTKEAEDFVGTALTRAAYLAVTEIAMYGGPSTARSTLPGWDSLLDAGGHCKSSAPCRSADGRVDCEHFGCNVTFEDYWDVFGGQILYYECPDGTTGYEGTDAEFEMKLCDNMCSVRGALGATDGEICGRVERVKSLWYSKGLKIPPFERIQAEFKRQLHRDFNSMIGNFMATGTMSAYGIEFPAYPEDGFGANFALNDIKRDGWAGSDFNLKGWDGEDPILCNLNEQGCYSISEAYPNEYSLVVPAGKQKVTGDKFYLYVDACGHGGTASAGNIRLSSDGWATSATPAEWVSQMVSKCPTNRTWVVDVTQYISEDDADKTYKIKFEYTGGDNALWINRVWLTKGELDLGLFFPASTVDEHVGHTGASTWQNTYTVTIDQANAGQDVDHYLVADVCGLDGTDTYGTIWVDGPYGRYLDGTWDSGDVSVCGNWKTIELPLSPSKNLPAGTYTVTFSYVRDSPIDGHVHQHALRIRKAYLTTGEEKYIQQERETSDKKYKVASKAAGGTELTLDARVRDAYEVLRAFFLTEMDADSSTCGVFNCPNHVGGPVKKRIDELVASPPADEYTESPASIVDAVNDKLDSFKMKLDISGDIVMDVVKTGHAAETCAASGDVAESWHKVATPNTQLEINVSDMSKKVPIGSKMVNLGVSAYADFIGRDEMPSLGTVSISVDDPGAIGASKVKSDFSLPDSLDGKRLLYAHTEYESRHGVSSVKTEAQTCEAEVGGGGDATCPEAGPTGCTHSDFGYTATATTAPWGGGRAIPELYELDASASGKEMIVGDADGKIYAYRFNGKDLGWGLLGQMKDDTGDAERFTSYTTGWGRAAPTMGDFDGDGDIDLLVGDSNGLIWQYERASAGLDNWNLVGRVSETLSGKNTVAVTKTLDPSGTGCVGYFHPCTDPRTISIDLPLSHSRDVKYVLYAVVCAHDGTTSSGSISVNGQELDDGWGPDIEQCPGQNVLQRDVTGMMGSQVAQSIEFDHTGGGHALGIKSLKLIKYYWQDPVPRLHNLEGDSKLELVVGTGEGGVRYLTYDGGWSSQGDLSANVDANAVPAFADIDLDGDLDMAIGSDGGEVKYYERTGNDVRTGWNYGGYLENDPGSGDIDVGDYSAPVFIDANDPLYDEMDLLVGGADGKIRYYENKAPFDVVDGLGRWTSTQRSSCESLDGGGGTCKDNNVTGAGCAWSSAGDLSLAGNHLGLEGKSLPHSSQEVTFSEKIDASKLGDDNAFCAQSVGGTSNVEYKSVDVLYGTNVIEGSVLYCASGRCYYFMNASAEVVDYYNTFTFEVPEGAEVKSAYLATGALGEKYAYWSTASAASCVSPSGAGCQWDSKELRVGHGSKDYLQWTVKPGALTEARLVVKMGSSVASGGTISANVYLNGALKGTVSVPADNEWHWDEITLGALTSYDQTIKIEYTGESSQSSKYLIVDNIKLSRTPKGACQKSKPCSAACEADCSDEADASCLGDVQSDSTVYLSYLTSGLDSGENTVDINFGNISCSGLCTNQETIPCEGGTSQSTIPCPKCREQADLTNNWYAQFYANGYTASCDFAGGYAKGYCIEGLTGNSPVRFDSCYPTLACDPVTVNCKVFTGSCVAGDATSAKTQSWVGEDAYDYQIKDVTAYVSEGTNWLEVYHYGALKDTNVYIIYSLPE